MKHYWIVDGQYTFLYDVSYKLKIKYICGFDRFDIIVDCAGLGSGYAIESQLKFNKYVTFTTPILKNFDNLGLVRGLLTSVSNLFCPNVTALKHGGRIMWAYFVPSNEGITYIHNLVSSGKVCNLFYYSQ